MAFKKQKSIKRKLNRDKEILNNVIDYFKRRYLNKEMDLQQALSNIEENHKDYFSKKTHRDFYRKHGHFKSYIEEYFNKQK